MSVLANVELVMWSPQEKTDPPLIRAVRQALRDGEFPEQRAGDIPVSTAFRRAVKALETKETKVTVWHNGMLHAQLDQLVPEGERIHREFVTRISLDEKSGAITGHLPDLPAFQERYTWADVSMVVQAVLKEDGLGAYTPRRAGGVYFVPVTSRDLLDRLESVCRWIGLNLLRYQVPDTSAQRSEIADAVAASLVTEADLHNQALAAYSEETRAGVVNNRREAIAATVALVNRLLPHLVNRAQPLLDFLAQLDQQAVNLIARIEAYRPAARGRRIVTDPFPQGDSVHVAQ